jgi:hypothetical protein
MEAQKTQNSQRDPDKKSIAIAVKDPTSKYITESYC